MRQKPVVGVAAAVLLAFASIEACSSFSSSGGEITDAGRTDAEATPDAPGAPVDGGTDAPPEVDADASAARRCARYTGTGQCVDFDQVDPIVSVGGLGTYRFDSDHATSQSRSVRLMLPRLDLGEAADSGLQNSAVVRLQAPAGNKQSISASFDVRPETTPLAGKSIIAYVDTANASAALSLIATWNANGTCTLALGLNASSPAAGNGGPVGQIQQGAWTRVELSLAFVDGFLRAEVKLPGKEPSRLNLESRLAPVFASVWAGNAEYGVDLPAPAINFDDFIVE